jgi:hypothetical protein
LVIAMNRREQLETEIAEHIAEIAERRSRADDPMTVSREWTTPPREAPPDYITRTDVHRVVAAAIMQWDERLIDALSRTAEVLGEEVAAITDPLARRLSQIEAELRALRESKPCPTIIRP